MTNFFSDQHAPEKETALIALSLVVYVLYWYFLGTDFSLQPGSSFLIGQATLDGQDVGHRVSFFYKAIGVFILGWPSCYLLLRSLFHVSGLRQGSRHILVLPLTVALMLMLSDVVGMRGWHAVNLILCISGLMFCMLLCGERIRALRFFRQPLFVSASLALSCLLTLTGMSLWNQVDHWSTQFIWSFALVSLAVMACCAVVRLVFNSSMGRLFSACRYLAWIPLCIWLGIEVAFWARLHGHAGWTFGEIILVLFMLWIVLVIVYRRYRPGHMNTKDVLAYALVPGVIGLFVLHIFYRPVMALPDDLFELANPLNAQLNLWEFHRIPCIDFLSSHLLSEQWYGWLYHLFFGYHANPDFLIYKALEYFLCYGVLYVFLQRIFRDAMFSLIMVCCFPSPERLFTENLYLVLVLVLLFGYIAEKQSVKRYSVLLSFLLFSMLWRLDLGVSCLFTTLCALPLILFASRISIQWRYLLKVAIIFSTGLLLVTCAFMLLRSPSTIITNLQNALHYLGANQAHGYTQVAWEWNQHTVFFYVLLPFSSCLFIFYLLYLLRTKQHADRQQIFILHASLLLFIFMLFNFQRGLVRHGFVEQNDTFLSSTYYLAVSLFMLYLLWHRSRVERFLLFFAVSWFQIVILSYFPLGSDATALEKLMSASTLNHLDDQLRSHAAARVESTAAHESFRELDSLLNATIRPDQTMFDFSNSPSSYYFTRRRIPSYFCQSLQNTVDRFTQLQQLRLLDTTLVPVVLYANSPMSWYDATDDVPNALRYPYLAEYIYRYYAPFTTVSNKQVWIARHRRRGRVEFVLPSEVRDYRKAAGLLSAYYEQSGFKSLVCRNESVVHAMPDSSVVFLPHSSVSHRQHVLLRLDFNDPKDGQAELLIRSGAGQEARLRFLTSHTQQSYMLRVSNLYVWQQEANKTIRISGSGVQSLTTIRWYEELVD